MKFYFEDDGRFLAVSDAERVLIRVDSDEADIGWTESIDQFVARHGGPEKALDHLRTMSRRKFGRGPKSWQPTSPAS